LYNASSDGMHFVVFLVELEGLGMKYLILNVLASPCQCLIFTRNGTTAKRDFILCGAPHREHFKCYLKHFF